MPGNSFRLGSRTRSSDAYVASGSMSSSRNPPASTTEAKWFNMAGGSVSLPRRALVPIAKALAALT